MMKERFETILREFGPKHWSRGVRKDQELLDWINQHTSDLPDDTPFAERSYCAVYSERPDCLNGNKRKLRSITDGWMFCGRAGRCACTREQVSKSVSASKQMTTEEEKDTTQKKREATNLERYGHVNTGQTEKARQAHQEFYANVDNVRSQLQKHAATHQERYGVSSPAHIPEVAEKRKATNLERYGVENPMQCKEIAEKSAATRLAQGYSQDYYRRNYERMVDFLLNEAKLTLLTPFEQYNGVAGSPELSLECPSCHRQRTWRVTYHYTPRCVYCFPRDPSAHSMEEAEVFRFIKDKLGIPDLLSGDRSLIAPSEIDILSENHRVAIEYNGLYWHSELQQAKVCEEKGWDIVGPRSPKNYHKTKLEAVEQQGFQLFTIYSDEWKNHPDIVKSKICHLFGRIEDRRFARKMTLCEISHKEAAPFYDQSHIQGRVRAKHHYALKDGNDIVAAMSFTPARETRGLPPNSFELVRFASLSYVSVVGGASRLFKHFIRAHTPAAILSYADRRWSNGNLYHQLGFVLEQSSAPSFDVIPPGYIRRDFRFNYRKEVLQEALGNIDATEWEMLQFLGYDRIWNCGTHRFVWTP